MKTLFLVGCALAAWWLSRGWGWVGQLGLMIIFTLLSILLAALIGVLRALISGRHVFRNGMTRAWHVDDETEQVQQTIDWVPLQGSPEDPLRNPWHAPDHQNPIDPNSWL